VNRSPLGRPNAAARDGWMNPSPVQNLGGVEISHPGQDALVQKGRLDRPTARAQPRAKLFRRDLQGIGTELFRHEAAELLRRRHPHDAKPPRVPEHQPVGAIPEARKLHDPSEVFFVGRAGKHEAAGHARLDDDSLAGVQLDQHPLAGPAHVHHAASDRFPSKLRDGRLDRDRPQACQRNPDIVDPRPEDRCDSSTHRFHFRQLGHGAWRRGTGSDGAFARGHRGFEHMGFKQTSGPVFLPDDEIRRANLAPIDPASLRKYNRLMFPK